MIGFGSLFGGKKDDENTSTTMNLTDDTPTTTPIGGSTVTPPPLPPPAPATTPLPTPVGNDMTSMPTPPAPSTEPTPGETANVDTLSLPSMPEPQQPAVLMADETTPPLSLASAFVGEEENLPPTASEVVTPSPAMPPITPAPQANPLVAESPITIGGMEIEDRVSSIIAPPAAILSPDTGSTTNSHPISPMSPQTLSSSDNGHLLPDMQPTPLLEDMPSTEEKAPSASSDAQGVYSTEIANQVEELLEHNNEADKKAIEEEEQALKAKRSEIDNKKAQLSMMQESIDKGQKDIEAEEQEIEELSARLDARKARIARVKEDLTSPTLS